MAGSYRPSRNIESSIIKAIRQILIDNHFENTTVVKNFKRAYDIPLDPKEKNAIICVRCGNTIYEGVELGSNTKKRKPLALIDIFAQNDGQRLDLKDLLIDKLKEGIDYIEHIVAGGATSNAEYTSKKVNGKIRVESIDDTEINFGVDKRQLSPSDRYRHLISLHCAKTLLEE